MDGQTFVLFRRVSRPSIGLGSDALPGELESFLLEAIQIYLPNKQVLK